jgi:hypothetical protein
VLDTLSPAERLAFERVGFAGKLQAEIPAAQARAA